MAQGFTIEIVGMKSLLNKHSKMAAKLEQEFGGELEASANNIARNAKRDVPVDTGRLKNAISPHKVGKLTFEVVAQADYAAFVEFGTGTFVTVPAGLEEYASQFKGRGVRQVNLPARPYLISNYLRERPELSRRLKQMIKNL